MSITFCADSSFHLLHHGSVQVVEGGHTCAEFGFVDIDVVPTAQLSPDDINMMFTQMLVLWAVCFMLRFVRQLIPRGVT